VINKIDEAEN